MLGGEQQLRVPRGPTPGWRNQAGLCGSPQREIVALVVAFHNPIRTWGSPLRPQGVSKETELRFFCLFVCAAVGLSEHGSIFEASDGDVFLLPSAQARQPFLMGTRSKMSR